MLQLLPDNYAPAWRTGRPPVHIRQQVELDPSMELGLSPSLCPLDAYRNWNKLESFEVGHDILPDNQLRAECRSLGCVKRHGGSTRKLQLQYSIRRRFVLLLPRPPRSPIHEPQDDPVPHQRPWFCG